MSDEEDNDSFCDWCSKETKRLSLVMGYNGKWGSGEMICTACLNQKKPNLYCVKYSGRQMFASDEYYHKYWTTESNVKVVRTPTDHWNLLKQKASKQKTRPNQKKNDDVARKRQRIQDGIDAPASPTTNKENAIPDS